MPDGITLGQYYSMYAMDNMVQLVEQEDRTMPAPRRRRRQYPTLGELIEREYPAIERDESGLEYVERVYSSRTGRIITPPERCPHCGNSIDIRHFEYQGKGLVFCPRCRVPREE